ncbi:ATP-binding cassette domain-containing protein [Paracoccus zhejiangensis]|uniref:Uncharacterized protein n=1 Tax=Paracoccus zhejiangensis TaxID=1077935 RepID=A0A2H5F617_9RHOB|nr:ABC transporter ATP-binding protein [Paracoccus zhejiangensis]AUH66992.1 hypothetical protein CX676_22135 [Paracoccus zhejiangensis]
MDEPTSALDLNRQIEVLSLVSALAVERDMAVLIAIHDLNHTLRFCSDVIVIVDGRMHSAGKPGDIITPAFLREVYGVEARVEHCSKGLPHIIIDHHRA